VPHDIDVHAPKAPAKPEPPVVEDADDSQDDVNALFAAVNDLPADDPLRAQPAAGAKSAPSSPSNPVASASIATSTAPEATNAAVSAPPAASHASDQAAGQAAPEQTARVEVESDEKRLKVPSLVGLPLRKVIEVSAAAGLAVHMTGSGTAREQAPAAGTMVPAGTEIVVRCAR